MSRRPTISEMMNNDRSTTDRSISPKLKPDRSESAQSATWLPVATPMRQRALTARPLRFDREPQGQGVHESLEVFGRLQIGRHPVEFRSSAVAQYECPTDDRVRAWQPAVQFFTIDGFLIDPLYLIEGASHFRGAACLDDLSYGDEDLARHELRAAVGKERAEAARGWQPSRRGPGIVAANRRHRAERLRSGRPCRPRLLLPASGEARVDRPVRRSVVTGRSRASLVCPCTQSVRQVVPHSI